MGVCIWGAVLRTSPRCTTMRGYRSVLTARTCSIEGMGQLRYPIPQMLIMVLRSVWRGSFATPPPDVNVATGLSLTARTCSIEGMGQLRYTIPNLGNNETTRARDRPGSKLWPSTGEELRPVPHLYDNDTAIDGSRCIWGAVLRTSPRCTTMRGLQVRARGTDL